jgi:superfamily II DNA or RNA helicase
MNLRDYQNGSLDKSLERYRAGVNRQLIVMATGLGKAVLFAALRSHHKFSKRVMVLVHREELAKQAADKIHRWNPGLMIGTEMASSYAAPMDNFVVGSVPTLGRAGSQRLARFDPESFDCIVSDEAHHSVSPQWKRVLDHFGLLGHDSAHRLSLGLTATPNRADGTGLRECFDEIVYDMGIDAGIQQGYLVDLRCWRVETKTGLDKVHTVAGDFNQGELADAVNTPERNMLIVKAWAKHAFNKKSIVFTVDVQHALDLAEAFKALGVTCAAVWGEDPERADKLRQHRTGAIRVLTNCAVLTEGYDDAEIECVVLAKPTKSALLLTQMIGRGTRIPEGVSNMSEVGEFGKQNCIILDVADATSKHQICSVPSLLGMPKDLDMKGETYRKAREKLERVAKEFPTANLADLRDLGKLNAITEQISLFQVKYPVEISSLTELAWRKQGEGYWLPVDHGRVTLAQDLRGDWWTRGTVAGKVVEIQAQNLAGAFNAADRAVTEMGGNRALYARDARWRNDSPSPKQVELCAKVKLNIPAGATRGMVSAALDAHFAKRRA